MKKLLMLAVLAFASTSAVAGFKEAASTKYMLPYLASIQAAGGIVDSGKRHENPMAMKLPLVLVYGQGGCFAGAYTFNALDKLSSKCRPLSEPTPPAVAAMLDKAKGGVVVVSVKNCVQCTAMNAAAAKFAKTAHPAKRWSELPLGSL